jgi:hypothetical protein
MTSSTLSVPLPSPTSVRRCRRSSVVVVRLVAAYSLSQSLLVRVRIPPTPPPSNQILLLLSALVIILVVVVLARLSLVNSALLPVPVLLVLELHLFLYKLYGVEDPPRALGIVHNELLSSLDVGHYVS